ncbi:MAG: SRPBCC family protein [Gemmatimonadales bacterium]|nr:SRPBCC family protein [Gemmatimonadales bacterium]
MLKRVLITLAVLLFVLLALGFVLPSKVSLARSTEIKAPPDAIYPLLVAPKAWPRWSVWNRRDPAMTITWSGPESGVGAAWAWTSKSEGNGAMTLTAAEPGRRVGYELRFEGMQPSTGALVLEPSGTGTRVTWSMDADMGGGPLGGWFGLLMPGMVGKDFDAGLANLKAEAEKGS